MAGEFELIARHFTRPQRTPRRSPRHADLGVGDDCALLPLDAGMQMAVSTDMLVEGRHFLSTVAPERLGHKALAVNLSDLAACGATPRAFFLALALPRADAGFLEGFARGLFKLADAHGITLAGGDTTAGPLNLCITVMGEAPAGQALLRSGARPGDELWVSGMLGDARLALEVFRGTLSLPGEDFSRVRLAMECPQPRLALGQALRGIATSAVDVSDGLVGDLGHVLKASGAGAEIDFTALPRSAILARQALAVQQECLLAGGDDYELVFTAPAARHEAVLEAAALAGTPVHRVGRIRAERGLAVLDPDGAPMAMPFASFDHFKS